MAAMHTSTMSDKMCTSNVDASVEQEDSKGTAEIRIETVSALF